MTVPRVLVCGAQLPEYDRESGSRRLWDFISFLRDEGWAVSVLVERTDGDPRIAHALRRNGIATYTGLNDQSADLLAYGQFDLALLSFWYVAERFLPLIRDLAPCTRIIVDSVDLQFLRAARRHFGTAARECRLQALDHAYGEEAARELNSYGAADLVLCVSQKEASLIQDFTGGSVPAVCIPDAEEFPRSPLPFSERRGMLFVGNFRHPPNAEGLAWLLRDVFPLLPRDLLSDHPLAVVGTAADEILPLVAGVRGVNVVGWVPEVRPYFLQSRISLLPLLHGAGTKRKLIQSLMSGTPAVSTSIGVEGLGIASGAGALVADQPHEFAQSIIEVLRDSATWNDVADAGEAHVRTQHGRDTVRSRFLAAVEATQSLPPRVPKVHEHLKVTPRRGAFISADPSVVLAWPAAGSTEIRWSTGAQRNGQVRVSVDDAPETLFADGETGSEMAAWIRPGVRYSFRLYDGDGSLLAVAPVRGIIRRSQ